MTHDDYEVIATQVLDTCEHIALQLASQCLRVATYFERLANEFRETKIGLVKKRAPTLQQWVNRFIEYADGPWLILAYTRFAWLVENGLEPEHAFDLVVGKHELQD